MCWQRRGVPAERAGNRRRQFSARSAAALACVRYRGLRARSASPAACAPARLPASVPCDRPPSADAGYPPRPVPRPLDPEVRHAWETAQLVLKEEGAELVAVDIPQPPMEVYRTVQMPEASLAHMQQGWLSERADLYTERTRERLVSGQKIAAV